MLGEVAVGDNEDWAEDPQVLKPASPRLEVNEEEAQIYTKIRYLISGWGFPLVQGCSRAAMDPLDWQCT